MSAVLNQLPASLFRQILRHRLLPYIAFLAPWIILRSVVGIAIGVVLLLIEAIWLWQQTQRHYVSWLDAQFPELEDSTSLLAKSSDTKNSVIIQLQRTRLASRLSSLLTTEKLTQISSHVLPWRRLYLVISFLLACVMYFANPTDNLLQKNASVPTIAQTTFNKLPQLSIKITPPTYTQLPIFSSQVKPLQVPEHSQISWCLINEMNADMNADINQGQATQYIRLSNGQELAFTQTGRTTCANWEATETVFWTWSADPKQERINLNVVLDQAPEISIKEPKELLQILASNTQNIAMQVQVRDDYQVASASMHLTLARGSGENVRFSDKEVPLPQSADKRSRNWNKRWTLAELGMEAGDELYFFVRAIDNAGKNPHVVRSPTYTLRLPAANADDEEISVLPILAKAESLRSQRQIIIDTEQLLADMAANTKLNSMLIRSRSEAIANDQAALRRRYGRFLGEESSLFGDEHEDENHENENHAGENSPVDLAAQYGHAHDQAENATLFDEATKKILRRALVAMWDAEKSLRAITPKTALAPENKALVAIKELQQADRIYLHKAAFTPPAIQEEKRLSGDVLDVRNKQRTQSEFEDAVPTQTKELLIALGKDVPLPALWSETARATMTKYLRNDEQRLQAQATVQDVADGCLPCRAVLAAWLRQSISGDTLRLQAKPIFKAKTPSRFEQRWKDANLSGESK